MTIQILRLKTLSSGTKGRLGVGSRGAERGSATPQREGSKSIFLSKHNIVGAARYGGKFVSLGNKQPSWSFVRMQNHPVRSEMSADDRKLEPTIPITSPPVTNFIQLPVLPLELCKLTPQLAVIDKVNHAINKGTPFSGLLHRLKTKGQERMRAKFFCRRTTVEVSPLSNDNYFLSLSDVRLSNEASGSFQHEITWNSVRKSKNEKFSLWCDKMLGIKKARAALKTRLLKPLYSLPRLPSDTVTLRDRLKEHYHGIKSRVDFLHRTLQLLASKSCPLKKSHELRYTNRVLTLEQTGTNVGLGIYSGNKLISHMGEDSYAGKLPIEKTVTASGRGLVGRHCKICKRDEQGMHLFQTSAEQVNILHSLVCLKCYTALDEDRVELLDNTAVPEWYFKEPSSPKSAASFERLSRRLSSTSATSSHISQNQTILDEIVPLQIVESIPNIQVLEQRMGSVLKMSVSSINPTILFAIAYAYKREYGCPTDHKYALNFKRMSNVWSFDRSEGTEEKGLYLYIDNTMYYHCGTEKFRKNMWKAAFFASQARQSTKLAASSMTETTAVAHILAARPAFDKELIGFTVCAALEGTKIFARGLDFTREDETGSGKMITTRQRRLFWNTGGKRLGFTLQGLAKVFWRKPQDQCWRFAIARAIGLTLLAAMRLFSKLANNPAMPDMILLDVTDELRPVPQQLKIKNVYVEIPVEPKMEDKPTVKPVVPVPPALNVVPRSLPRVKIQTEHKTQYPADGDKWLLAPGNEGKSRRALFRDTFKSDWWRRVSESALRIMNQDASAEIDYKSRAFNKHNLIVDPALTFDLNMHRYSSPIADRLPAKKRSISLPEAPTSNADTFKERRSLLRKVPPSDMRVAPNLMAGKVLQPLLARDSTKADIETNPGPSEEKARFIGQRSASRLRRAIHRKSSVQQTDVEDSDGSSSVLTVHHPIPMRGALSGHNRTYSAPVVTDTGSPLDGMKFNLTEDTLTRDQADLLIKNLHQVSRNADNEDVEENPGPSPSEAWNSGKNAVRALSRSPSRGRTKDKPIGESLRPETSRSQSRVRDIIGKIGLFSDDKYDDFKKMFGSPDVFQYQTKRASGFLSAYEHSALVGHLPADRDWKSQNPVRWFSNVGFSELQKSLDSLHVTNTSFTRVKLPEVLALVNKFFQQAKESTVSGSVVSAMAHFVKVSYNCPHDSYGYAFDINPEERTIHLYYTESPGDQLHNRIWWCMNGFEMLHGGSAIPSAPLGELDEQRDIIAIPPRETWEKVLVLQDLVCCDIFDHSFRYLAARRQIQKELDEIVNTGPWSYWTMKSIDLMAKWVEKYTNNGRLTLDNLAALAIKVKEEWGCPSEANYLCNFTMTGELEIFKRPIGMVTPMVVWSVHWIPIIHGSSSRSRSPTELRRSPNIIRLSPEADYRELFRFTSTEPSVQHEVNLFDRSMQRFSQSAINSFDKNTVWSVWDENEEERFGRWAGDAIFGGYLSIESLLALAIRVKTYYGCPTDAEYVCNVQNNGVVTVLSKPSSIPRLIWSYNWIPILHGGREYSQEELLASYSNETVIQETLYSQMLDEFGKMGKRPPISTPFGRYMSFFKDDYWPKLSLSNQIVIGELPNEHPFEFRLAALPQILQGFQREIDNIETIRDEEAYSGVVVKIGLQIGYEYLKNKGRVSLDLFSQLAKVHKKLRGCPSDGKYYFFDFNFTDGLMKIETYDSGYETGGQFWFCADSLLLFHCGTDNPELSRPFKLADQLAREEADRLVDKFIGDQGDALRHTFEPPGIAFDSDMATFLWPFFYVYSYIHMLIAAYQPYFRPNLGHIPANVSKSDRDYEGDEDPSNSLLVCTLGTRGDQVPAEYYGNVAGFFGVRTHIKRFHNMSTDDLEKLKLGDMYSTLPGYLDLHHATELGYKKIFTPHLEVDSSKGMSYSLSPSVQWIRPVSFVHDWSKVKFYNVIPSILATRLNAVFSPTWRIGAIKGSDLPRSHDSLRLLEKKTNIGTVSEGWTSGSGAEKYIPNHVRENLEKIPTGDHNEIFRRYKTIHMHGGAGTVQTAIACGSEVVIHDPTLDRDYIRLPTSNDFKQPTISPFMGWLVMSGFDIPVPSEVKFIWIMAFLWSTKYDRLYSNCYSLVKVYTIIMSLCAHWLLFVLVFFSISLTIWRAILKQTSLIAVVKLVFKTFWDFPILCLIHSQLGVVIFLWSLKKIWMKATQDYVNSVKVGMQLVYEPVEREGVKFPFPFGHWSLLDSTTGDVYEGKFQEKRQTMGALFKMISSKRELKQGNRVFPAPFSVAKAKKIVKFSEPRPYSSVHNCATMALEMVSERSFFWSFFMSGVTFLIFIALSPPETLRWFLDKLFPGVDVRDTPFYRSLGFAAGIENIPFEMEEDIENDTKFAAETGAVKEPDWSNPNSFKMLLDEIAVIQTEINRLNIHTLDTSDLEEVSARALEKKLMEVPLTENKLWEFTSMPPYVKGTWAEIVDGLHHGMSVVRKSRLVDCFIAWLHTIEKNLFEFIFPMLDMLSFFLHLCLEHSTDAFNNLFVAVCRMLDNMWGLEASKRVKTAWGLTGLHRTGLLGARAKLAANIAYSEFVGRTTFEEDFKAFVQNADSYAAKVNARQRRNIGGPQRRPIGYSMPLMNKQQADLLGFKEGEYSTDETMEQRVQSYLDQGVKQGGDGVFLADKMPELIAKSQHRYEPKYPELNSDERAFAKEIAQAMFDHYPTVFANADIMPPKSVFDYIKKKYSPGTPFIKPGGFKSRQAMFDAGFDKAMQKNAIDMLESGKYPVQFYHAFVKSQVVDIQKCLPEEMGGKNKDVRTVVSQDLWSYYIDQCLQIERNKRINWDVYGAGIGMPLNQSMEKIYSKMADKQKERGGRYIIADATAFDSFCKPFLFEVNAVLWELGFRDHPSGNGKNMASVLRASYQSRSSGGSWIIGVTEPEYKNLVLSIPDASIRAKVRSQNPDTTIDLSELLPKGFRKLPKDKQSAIVKELEMPEHTTVLSWDPTLRPKRANWVGSYVIGDTSSVSSTFFANQTLTYEEQNADSLLADVKAVVNSNYSIMSNAHPKNRGGSTGGSDTSNVNTHAFKAGVIYAWCKTTGRRPSEFFEYNTIANTSDDTIWQSGGKFGLNTVDDVQTFAKHCSEVGIHLEIDTTKDISKVEYLSKFVRVPTAEDSMALKAWRTSKINAISHTNKQKGFEGITEEQIASLNNPRFVVVQNPSAILLRRSAFRYYQSVPEKWRYISVERGAGHANNTAFVPQLYSSFAKEWCDDVNLLLQQQNIHRRFELKIGKFGLQEVQQVDTRSSQQSLSPRQKAFLEWLKGNMFPSYYKVIDIHMNVAKIDPEQHAKFIKKLERGWRGWNEIMKEGVDGLFAATDAIPDEWSKKFQPGIEMLYAERPFYTRNKIVEKFAYLKLLEESPEHEISFSDFSQRIQESPYGAVCDPYHFWEQIQNKEFKEKLMQEETLRIQGLVMAISALYMLTNLMETMILSMLIIGPLYKLFLWKFIGLAKVYGVAGTLYWHATGKSSRELSRIMPRDPYMVSKQFCAFVVDLLPGSIGWFFIVPVHIVKILPPFLDSIGKTWYKAGTVKQVTDDSDKTVNVWDKYPEQYMEELRKSPTGFAYLAAKTATGKSSWWIAALWSRKHTIGVRKIWHLVPRIVLRKETSIPLGVRHQELYRKVTADPTIDVYTLTYGHAQSRIQEMDPENDLVLFDEFHEESGEMIHALHTIKCKSFLLSATPVEIPRLKGSPYLTPDIDQRYPTTIIKTDDSMSIPDMFLEAQNRYPEQCKRALIIVPTHKMCEKIVNSLNYLKVGEVNVLSARQRNVPRTGIIVATPYVQTGLDIKPPPLILIDSGKDLVINKGVLTRIKQEGKSSFPWTTADVNKQRIGRVSRLAPGVVFQPKSAGTGTKPVTYPSPNMFMHKHVAEHFGVEPLVPQGGAVCADLPFMCVNTTRLITQQIRKSVVLVHTMALSGLKPAEWEAMYTRVDQRVALGDENVLIDRVMSLPKWINIPLLSYNQAMFHVNRENVVNYSFEAKKIWCRPQQVVNGKWIPHDLTSSHQVEITELPESEVTSRYEKIQAQLNHYKSCMLRHAASVGDKEFASAVTAFTT